MDFRFDSLFVGASGEGERNVLPSSPYASPHSVYRYFGSKGEKGVRYFDIEYFFMTCYGTFYLL